MINLTKFLALNPKLTKMTVTCDEYDVSPMEVIIDASAREKLRHGDTLEFLIESMVRREVEEALDKTEFPTREDVREILGDEFDNLMQNVRFSTTVD